MNTNPSKLAVDSKTDQLNIIVEVVTLDSPNPDVLGQAFEKIRGSPNYLKPIVMEGLARKLKVSRKTLEKAFECWVMERISQIPLADARNSQNGEKALDEAEV